MRNIAKVFLVTGLVVLALVLNGCASGGGAEAGINNVAATVNGHNIMLSEVERVVNQQAGGDTSKLNQLQMAQARLAVLSTLIQREVLFQRAEREKVLP
ncbi:MAG TPA: SurA N-terminal domain-containing protein, partial [Pyrinomonadaceae bacterium]